MRIWLFTQYFYPEMGAPAARFFDFGCYLARNGHHVTAFTGFPNFPRGKVHESYRTRVRMQETVCGIEVIRRWYYTRENAGPGAKGIGYLTFAATSTASALFHRYRPDVILATTPPPTATIPAKLLASWHKTPWVMDIRDLWPEALVASGRLKVGPTTLALDALNRSSLHQSSAIVTVSHGKRQRLIDLGIKRSKVAVIPNGVDLDYWETAQREHRKCGRDLLRAFGIPDNASLLVYAGIMNAPQGLLAVLGMAQLFQQQGINDIFTVLVGEGQQRLALQQFADDNGLTHVRLIPQQPREIIAALYGLATAILVPLSPRKDTHTVPSKVFEAMGSGKPILLSATGEVANIVAQACAGIVVPPGDSQEMANAAIRLCHTPSVAESLGRAGHTCAATHFDRRILNARYERLLAHVAAGGTDVANF